MSPCRQSEEDDDDEQQQCPAAATLNLSGLAGRRRRRGRGGATQKTTRIKGSGDALPKKNAYNNAASGAKVLSVSGAAADSNNKKKSNSISKRKRSSDRYYDDDAPRRPPIPSSFVDTDALTAMEADFFRGDDKKESSGSGSSSSNPKKRSNAEKQAVREKLGALKHKLDGDTSEKISNNNNNSKRTNEKTDETSDSNSGDDDDDDLFQPVFATKKKNNSTELPFKKNKKKEAAAAAAIANNTNAKTTTAEEDDDNDDDPPAQTSSSSSCTGNNNQGASTRNGATGTDDDDDDVDNREQELLQATIRDCYQAMDDGRTRTTGDVVKAVAHRLGWSQTQRRAHRPQIIRELEQLIGNRKKKQKKQQQPQQQQPTLDDLHAAVDRAFAAIPPHRLPSCSVREFVQATEQIIQQGGGGVPAFTKETRRRVKQRVAALLLQQPPAQQQQHSSAVAAIPDKSSVPLQEEQAGVPPLPKPTGVSEKKNEQSLAKPCVAAAAEEITEPSEPLEQSTRVLPTNDKSSEPSKTSAHRVAVEKAAEPAKTQTDPTKPFTDPTAENMDSAVVVVKPKKAQTAENTDDAIAVEVKPKKAAPRRPRTAKAAATTKAKPAPAPAPPRKDATMENHAFSETAPSAKAPAAKGHKRARAAKSCNLCAKCPCKLRDRDSLGGGPLTKIEFAQSDAAIEKALMKRLVKLEETTDQYEEQTDAVRRRLKKHRRDIWKKRDALLKRYDERQAKRKGTTTLSTTSRFLPDVDEFHQQLETEHLRKKRRTNTAVAQAQQAVFATTKPKIQPTLTQMFGGGKNVDDDETEEPLEKAVDSNGSEMNGDDSGKAVDRLDRALDSDGFATHNNYKDDEDDEDEISVEDDGYQQLCGPPSPAVRVESKSSSQTESADSPSKNAARHSVWDAVRNGNYNSSWDRLFYEEAEEVGVEHLLGLFGSSQQGDDAPSPASKQDGPGFSQSVLSIRGKSLAEAVTNQICADANKRSTIERVCPNWQENIAFAMGQKDEAEVSEALQNVQRAQAKLRRARLEILRKIEEEEAALGVFEESLQQSLTRFAPRTDSSTASSSSKESGPSEPTDVAFPARRAGLLAARHSVESEVRTILATPLSPSSRLLSSTATKPREGNADYQQHCKPDDTPMSVASRESLAVASQ